MALSSTGDFESLIFEPLVFRVFGFESLLLSRWFSVSGLVSLVFVSLVSASHLCCCVSFFFVSELVVSDGVLSDLASVVCVSPVFRLQFCVSQFLHLFIFRLWL